jgi:hypothetical protein
MTRRLAQTIFSMFIVWATVQHVEAQQLKNAIEHDPNWFFLSYSGQWFWMLIWTQRQAIRSKFSQT